MPAPGSLRLNMRAIDTNILVRLIVEDDSRQLAAGQRFIEDGVWISHLVLLEAFWVLESRYQYSHAQLARLLLQLQEQVSIQLQDPDIVEAAHEMFASHPALGFADCFILATARAAGHVPLGTFDRKLGKLPGAQVI